MTIRPVSIVVLATVALLGACHASQHPAMIRPTHAVAIARNQGYASLHSTLDEESGIADVLKIKDPSPQVVALIHAIAEFSRSAKSRLQAFAAQDPTLGLDKDGLSAMERNTRDAISSATAKQILFSRGQHFEFRILLTQHDALNYIAYLAGALSKHDGHEARKSYLAQLAKEAHALHERVIAQLEAPYLKQPQ